VHAGECVTSVHLGWHGEDTGHSLLKKSTELKGTRERRDKAVLGVLGLASDASLAKGRGIHSVQVSKQL
jgi:hypothetical protein